MWEKKQDGSIGDLLSTGICILGLTVVLMSFFDSVSMLRQKENVAQIARKYILRMETVGYLTGEDAGNLSSDLRDAGVTAWDFTGSTMTEAEYGAPITLRIRGRLRGEYEFEEKRVSTAKN